ncbi:MAG TPA: hypothetical protein VEJ20_09480, partial [Candidatus Eremiobacteraceae bacterium]|nr:hypothetical protein [Candidatus Eremiobacteraceae bacterium]
GVTNGTTNFVLSAMENGASFDDALAEAQRSGFTELDPSADLDGIDAAQKLSILAAVAFGARLHWRAIPRRGIRGLTPDDVTRARQRGARLKLVARARRAGSDIVASVSPEHVSMDSPLATTNGAENAFVIVTRHAGPVVVGGLGAGRSPTAAAIVGDLDDLAADGPRAKALASPGPPNIDAKETQNAL